jgi:DNA polymerase III delta prime subunit
LYFTYYWFHPCSHKPYKVYNNISPMSTSNEESQPWCEKYRPTQFENIVLDPYNKEIFLNMLEKKYFPNILLYGPPGTGKTTTIINLINAYQKSMKHVNRGQVIHLNASDERGIDIIRSQIYQFVKTKNLFEVGYKFVVLDEVDYMTKNAQQALKYLLQSCDKNVKFFLICNYISKIDHSLQQEFICIRFNQLPQPQIHQFIRDICRKEGLDISETSIQAIQRLYNSDIRSMINYVQLNQHQIMSKNAHNIMNNDVWEKMLGLLEAKNTVSIKQYIYQISIQYNMDKKQIIRDFYNYMIVHKMCNADFLDNVEVVIHNNECSVGDLIDYFAVYGLTA